VKQKTGLVLLTLASGQFLMTLDSSVMNVSIATVAKDVGTTVTGIQTAITLYTLVMAMLMIPGGKVGSLIGRKRAFSIGCVIYGAGSLTTALAQNLTVLILGWSLLEGIGAALILPAIVALVAGNFPPAGRPRAYGLVMAAGAIAVAVGPLIGGIATTYFSWRWVYVGEVLIVLVILVLARRVEDAPVEGRPDLDLVGAVLSATGLGLAVFGVLRSSVWGWVLPKPGGPEILGLSPTIVLIFGGLFVLWLFAAWERRVEKRGGEPLVQLSMFENRQFTGGLLMFFFQFLVRRALLHDPAVPLRGPRALRDRHGNQDHAAVHHAPDRCRRHPTVLPERLAASGRPRRTPGDVRRDPVAVPEHRRGRRRRDRDGAAAARGPGYRRARLAARQRDGLGGSGRAEPRGRRAQNTATNLGASIGTALAGSLLIAALTASFLSGIQQNPDVPSEVTAQANVELADGIPFISDADLETALEEAGASADVTRAVLDENEQARLDGLRTALAALALIALIGLFFASRIPTEQPGATQQRAAPQQV
jgi:MFS family permease